jgi:hypothetical protein
MHQITDLKNTIREVTLKLDKARSDTKTAKRQWAAELSSARYKIETQENHIQMLMRDNSSLRAIEKNCSEYWSGGPLPSSDASSGPSGRRPHSSAGFTTASLDNRNSLGGESVTHDHPPMISSDAVVRSSASDLLKNRHNIKSLNTASLHRDDQHNGSPAQSSATSNNNNTSENTSVCTSRESVGDEDMQTGRSSVPEISNSQEDDSSAPSSANLTSRSTVSTLSTDHKARNELILRTTEFLKNRKLIVEDSAPIFLRPAYIGGNGNGNDNGDTGEQRDASELISLIDGEKRVKVGKSKGLALKKKTNDRIKYMAVERGRERSAYSSTSGTNLRPYSAK